MSDDLLPARDEIGQFLLYQTEDGGQRVEVLMEG